MADEAPSRDPSTRWIETTRGILSYAQLAPLLAERVLRVQEQIESGYFESDALDEHLVTRLHGEFCADLVPEWAGKWRSIKVRVGTHEPPPTHLVPVTRMTMIMRLSRSFGRNVWLAPAKETKRQTYERRTGSNAGRT